MIARRSPERPRKRGGANDRSPQAKVKQGDGKMSRTALAGIVLLFAVSATAGPDALGCFTRAYDRAHLAQHPDQLVSAVKLRIYRPPPGNPEKYWFLAQFRLRGKDETL